MPIYPNEWTQKEFLENIRQLEKEGIEVVYDSDDETKVK